MSSEAKTHDFKVLSTEAHVPLARRETAKVLADWGLGEDMVDTACLIVTELVTNVVKHAAVLSPTATVTLAADRGALVLTVCDTHPLKPQALPTAYGLGGRGLHLVKVLTEEVRGSHEVVADQATGGKRIVIRLPLVLAPI